MTVHLGRDGVATLDHPHVAEWTLYLPKRIVGVASVSVVLEHGDTKLTLPPLWCTAAMGPTDDAEHVAIALPPNVCVDTVRVHRDGLIEPAFVLTVTPARVSPALGTLVTLPPQLVCGRQFSTLVPSNTLAVAIHAPAPVLRAAAGRSHATGVGTANSNTVLLEIADPGTTEVKVDLGTPLPRDAAATVLALVGPQPPHERWYIVPPATAESVDVRTRDGGHLFETLTYTVARLQLERDDEIDLYPAGAWPLPSYYTEKTLAKFAFEHNLAPTRRLSE